MNPFEPSQQLKVFASLNIVKETFVSLSKRARWGSEEKQRAAGEAHCSVLPWPLCMIDIVECLEFWNRLKWSEKVQKIDEIVEMEIGFVNSINSFKRSLWDFYGCCDNCSGNVPRWRQNLNKQIDKISRDKHEGTEIFFAFFLSPR